MIIHFEQEDDARWIAEIASLPGVMAYGHTRQEAESKVQVLALRVLADKLEREHTTTRELLFTRS